jgi:hypothetical protein
MTVPFTLSLTLGVSTVPSPLKLMTSIMALGAVGLDPPGGVPTPVAANTYVPLRSATVHRFAAYETPGLFTGSRVQKRGRDENC